jgi:hypothetical protein
VPFDPEGQEQVGQGEQPYLVIDGKIKAQGHRVRQAPRQMQPRHLCLSERDGAWAALPSSTLCHSGEATALWPSSWHLCNCSHPLTFRNAGATGDVHLERAGVKGEILLVHRCKKREESKAYVQSWAGVLGWEGGGRRGKGFQRGNERNELFQCGEVGKTPLNL